MALSKNILLMLCSLLVVLAITWADNDDGPKDKENIYPYMHSRYDELGNKDGFVSYDEIKRALGATTEDEWKKEIEPHDDGDKLLNAGEFENWLSSFKKQEL